MIKAKAIFQLNTSGVLMSLDIIKVVRYQKYCVGLLTCEPILALDDDRLNVHVKKN